MCVVFHLERPPSQEQQRVVSQPSPIPVPSLQGPVPLVPSGPEAPAWSNVAPSQSGRGPVLKPEGHRFNT